MRGTHHTPITTATAKLLFDEQELPGSYYLGDGLGMNCRLVLKPDGEFTWKWSGCLGEYDRNSGTWKLSGDILVLEPRGSIELDMNLRFIPVKWAARNYLVDEYEMPGFCANAREPGMHFSGPRGHDYVKWNGEKLPPIEGSPIIPERYREFLEKGPVEAAVVRLEESGAVILDKGTADRITPGMLLARRDSFGFTELRVLSAGEHESVAQAFRYSTSFGPVSVGDRFTTGESFDRPRGTGYERFPEPRH